MPAPDDPGTRKSEPAGHQPYDALNGARIGALAGALLGAVAVAFIGVGGLVAVVLLAMAGGVIGYAWERGRGPGSRL